ncbi:MAG: hypothetical protein ABI876_12365 [Bacteroidota bacterium]
MIRSRTISLLGHGVIVAALAGHMLLTQLGDRPHTELLFVGPIAGLWAGFGPMRKSRGSLLLALVDVALIHVTFWYIVYEVIDLEGQIRHGLIVEGFSLFAIALAPAGIVLAVIIFWLARFSFWLAARLRNSDAT